MPAFGVVEIFPENPSMAREMIVRVSTPNDFDAVDGFVGASYSQLMATHYDATLLERALPIIGRANPVLLSSGRYYVAEIDGRIMGAGGWSVERPGTNEVEVGVGHIRHFAVVPEYAGQGVGRAIYERCEEAARLAGISRLDCYSSLNGTPFYSSLGFVTVEPYEAELEPGLKFPGIWMTRKIG